MGGRPLVLDHGFDVAAVQRRWRLESVEHDADSAAVSARADDDAFPAGEIWASRCTERAHPDAGPSRQRKPLRMGWRQGENERAAICGGRSGGGHHIEIRLWGQLADKHCICPRVKAENDAIVATSSVKAYISKDMSVKVAAFVFLQSWNEKSRFVAAVSLFVPLFSTTSGHIQGSWHSVPTRVKFFAHLRY